MAGVQTLPENVVRLADFRKRRRRPRRVASGREAGPQYYCLRCDADEFRLYAAGAVHCAHCGSLMRNLLVGPTQGEESTQ
jgi:DNA-directed RNA polymerase subunit RPC12/RpoP